MAQFNKDIHLSLLTQTIGTDTALAGCECLVCGEVPYEPTICRNCEFVFCMLCLKTWVKKTPTCPQCRQGIEIDKLTVSKLAQRTINDLPAACTNEGCTIRDKYENIVSHLSVCGHGVVKCPNDKCVQSMKRSEVEAHRVECVFEKETCNCGELVARNVKEQHLSHCGEIPATCTQCDSTVTRGALRYHATHECNNRTVECRNKEYTCTWTGLFTEYDNHLKCCDIEKFRGALEVITARHKQTEKILNQQIAALRYDVQNLQLLNMLTSNVDFKKIRIPVSDFMSQENSMLVFGVSMMVANIECRLLIYPIESGELVFALMLPTLNISIVVEGKVCIVDKDKLHAFKIPFMRSFDATNNKKNIVAIPTKQREVFTDKKNGYVHEREGEADSIYLWFIITKCVQTQQ